MKNFKSSKLFFLIILVFILFPSCSQKGEYSKAEGIIWNTLYHITYKGSSELQDSILPVLNEISKSLSVFDKQSLVAKLNISDSIEADKHLIRVYEKSKQIHKISNRHFDPTVSPLVDAWGFGIGHIPSADTLSIDSILNFVGFDKTYCSGNWIIKKDPRIRFNFSAIAKGYGCDALGEMFKRNGIVDYMVEIGGEVALSGVSPSGNLWSIAIDSPCEDLKPGEESVMILNLTDVGIATSGNYRNYREEGGNKTAHTISPLTGRPFQSEILSATVIANSCMEADALATACMAGTPSEAKELLMASHAEGLLILADTMFMTPGFQQFIK